ncbi:hypothetical protein CL1_0956 [Thermococcus cleftensis]|uniref:Uncharacterized protein n=1 Tax=Thermococcus cleftensis (strain DSM 27260 / KACC 17922 / CL1) TaxID=163003 RepID=I3ZTX5_THECF|nr:hypothetical protein [Thermococcus cleftensis]AFL95159.1 hypothetical protein CL1_0956 [Thermococcus cleftensis]
MRLVVGLPIEDIRDIDIKSNNPSKIHKILFLKWAMRQYVVFFFGENSDLDYDIVKGYILDRGYIFKKISPYIRKRLDLQDDDVILWFRPEMIDSDVETMIDLALLTGDIDEFLVTFIMSK